MNLPIVGQIERGGVPLPVYGFRVPAGFPSPAQDHLEQTISLDALFDIRAPHTYLIYVDGDSLRDIGIFDGDLLVVDRSLPAEHGAVVVAALNDEPMVKILHKRGTDIRLLSANDKYPPRFVLEGDELRIWGVVKFSVRSHGCT